MLPRSSTVVLYECLTCHFKDDAVDREDVPTCPAGGEPMVPVEYVPATESDHLREALKRVGRLAAWIERDRREPDKMLLYAADLRSTIARADALCDWGSQ